MAEERDEKELTEDLAIDDESASEVTGGQMHGQAHGEADRGALSEFVSAEAPRRTRRWRRHG
ncbi:MAG: hypothetical protein WB770_10850 [Acidimicrobiales bacterium]